MAIQPTHDQTYDFDGDSIVICADATATFDPLYRPSDPTEYANSEHRDVAPRTPALDEEDDLEDEDEDPDKDDDLDEDDDLEDDDEEEDEEEDDDLEDEDEDDEEDDDEDEDEEEEDEEDA